MSVNNSAQNQLNIIIQKSKICESCDFCNQPIDYKLVQYQDDICDIQNEQSNSRLTQIFRSATDILRQLQLDWATYKINAITKANQLKSNVYLVEYASYSLYGTYSDSFGDQPALAGAIDQIFEYDKIFGVCLNIIVAPAIKNFINTVNQFNEMFRNSTDEMILYAQQVLGNIIDANWGNPNCRENILRNFLDGCNNLLAQWGKDTSRVVIVDDINAEVLSGYYIWQKTAKKFDNCRQNVPKNPSADISLAASSCINKV